MPDCAVPLGFEFGEAGFVDRIRQRLRDAMLGFYIRFVVMRTPAGDGGGAGVTPGG